MERKMRIKNNSGQFWTGECFGVEQAAAEYDNFVDLPETLQDTDQDGNLIILTLEIFSNFDARYYAEGCNDSEASAE